MAEVAEKAGWFCKSSAKVQSIFGGVLTGEPAVELKATQVYLLVGIR
jgi:hypothetical protein